jgi:hypothetical protein
MKNYNIEIPDGKQVPNPNVPVFKTTGVSRLKFGFLLIVICLGFDIWGLGFQLCCKGFEGELRFRFQPGDKYYLWSVAEEKTTRVADGNQQHAERIVRLGWDFDVEEVDENDFAWVKYTYRRTAVKFKGPELEFEFDSNGSKPRMHLQALPLFLVTNEAFYVRISPQGRVDKINGLQAVIGSAKSRIPNLAYDDRMWVLGAIDEQFSETAIRRTLEDQMAVFPTATDDLTHPELVEGADQNSCVASWSRNEQFEDTPGVVTVVERIFRLRKPRTHFGSSADRSGKSTVPADQNGCGVAIVDVNVVVNSAPQVTFVRGVEIKSIVSGRGAGQVEIEEATGRIIRHTVTRDMVERTEVSASGPVLRVPPAPEPVRARIVTTFEMTRRPNGVQRTVTADSNSER